MASVTIKSIVDAPVYLADLYVTLQPLGVLTISRSTAQLESMTSLQRAMAAGEVTVTITPTSQEMASGYFNSFISNSQGNPGLFSSTPSPTGYIHTQNTPGTVWVITHTLGYNPAGIVVLSSGYQLDGFGIQYLQDGSSLRLSFDLSVSGVAYLS
jgi:hypothetical protein